MPGFTSNDYAPSEAYVDHAPWKKDMLKEFLSKEEMVFDSFLDDKEEADAYEIILLLDRVARAHFGMAKRFEPNLPSVSLVAFVVVIVVVVKSLALTLTCICSALVTLRSTRFSRPIMNSCMEPAIV